MTTLEDVDFGPEQLSSLTQNCLFNILKVEIRGFTVRLNPLRQREGSAVAWLEKGKGVDHWWERGKG